MSIKKGSTDKSVIVFVTDTATRAPKTGLTYASTGGNLEYARNSNFTTVNVPLADLATVSTAHTDGGFKELDATDAPGAYRVDLPDAAFAAGADQVMAYLTFDDCTISPYLIELVDNVAKDIYDIVSHADYGNAQLVRSATPANEILIDVDGKVTAGNIVTGSAPINIFATVFNQTSGTVTSGVLADTKTTNSVYHQLADAAGTLDADYEFDVTAFGVPSVASFKGRVTSIGNSLNIYAWDYVGAAWELIGDLPGQASPTDVEPSWDLLTTHVGTSGADLGKVKIRFYNTGLSSAALYIDKINVGYTVVQATNVYANGSIWYNSVSGGSSGSVLNYNGIPQRPVDNIADAMLLLTGSNLKAIQVEAGSAITLSEDYDHRSMSGKNHWELNLNGKDCDHAYFYGAKVNGTATGEPEFEHCYIETASLANGDFHACQITTKITVTAANNFHLDQCFCGCGGGLFPVLDYNGAGGAWVINRHYSGNIEVQNMSTGDTLVISGDGITLKINSNCSDGDIVTAGAIHIIDEASGAVTVNEDARLAHDLIADTTWKEPTSGQTTAGSFGKLVNDNLDDKISNVDDIVWDATQADHLDVGSTGKSLSDASTGGDLKDNDAEGC